MDNNFQSKFRVVGAIAVIVFACVVILLLFAQNKEKRDTAMKLRAFYSDMTQALLYARVVNGPINEWGWVKNKKNSEIIDENIAKDLQVAENCLYKSGNCMPLENYRSVGGKKTSVNLSKLPSLKLKNGISFAIETISSCEKTGSTCGIVFVDINGTQKPNMFGRDLFVFLIMNSYSLPFIPYNLKLSGIALSEDEKFGCNKKAEVAMYCSALIFSNGWSIGKTYPW